MTTQSNIEWTDATWSPVIGCTKESPGCKNCYAEREVETRWSKNPRSMWYLRPGRAARTGVARLRHGCASKPEAEPSPDASDPSGCAWNLNFNNGNSNINNRDNNNGFVVAVAPAGECEHAVPLLDLYRAWRRARRKKKPSPDQLQFDAAWTSNLLQLQRELEAGAWKPARSTCFIAHRPKTREIHAPHFRDRVVHHWLVPQLEEVFEPTFSFDSYSNRNGKGTHAAVGRLKDLVHQVHSGQGGGWYLQLDVLNFFNSIPRAGLWRILKRRIQRAGLPLPAQWAAHALLRSSPLAAGVVYRASPAERELVPPHKRLENAPPGRGLPIGNLSSQYLANVFLDRLDQHIKRELRVPRYVRYVDDFVLVHRDRAQLAQWHLQIRDYLRCELQLELKADFRLRPLSAGIDFLGYVVLPTHTRIRRRVVAHASARFARWGQQHVHGDLARATPAEYRRARSQLAAFTGHSRHADAWKLRQALHQQFGWLHAVAGINRAFDYRLEGRGVDVAISGISIRRSQRPCANNFQRR